jgi:hypothetical protein
MPIYPGALHRPVSRQVMIRSSWGLLVPDRGRTRDLFHAME